MLANTFEKFYPPFFSFFFLFYKTNHQSQTREILFRDECPLMTLWRVVSLEVPNHKERKRTRRQMKVLESKVKAGTLISIYVIRTTD